MVLLERQSFFRGSLTEQAKFSLTFEMTFILGIFSDESTPMLLFKSKCSTFRMPKRKINVLN